MKKSHFCQAILVACMDFRLQKLIHNWAIKNIKGGYDLVAVAGGVKDLDFIVKQIELSVKLHHTKEAYLINHEDCGAYGKESTFEKHKDDLLLAQKKLKEKLPDLKIHLFYLLLDGNFVAIEK